MMFQKLILRGVMSLLRRIRLYHIIIIVALIMLLMVVAGLSGVLKLPIMETMTSPVTPALIFQH